MNKIVFDNVKAQLLLPPREAELFKNMMRVEAPGARYMKSHQEWLKSGGRRGWDGKTSLIGAEWMFPAGLIPKVLAWGESIGLSIDLDDLRPKTTFRLHKSNIPLKDYQLEAVQAVCGNAFQGFPWQRGIIKCPTGSGKTRIAAAIMDTFRTRALFLVHRIDLLTQTINALNELGLTNVGQFGAGSHNASHQITVATIQTIARQHQKDLGFLKEVELLIADEAHLVAANINKGNTFSQICGMTPAARVRIGLTATPFKRDIYSNLLLIGATGEILYNKTNAELIASGDLTPPQIIMQVTPKATPLSGRWADVYEAGVVLNAVRNDLVTQWAKEVPKPAIVMVVAESHGHILAGRLTKLFGQTIPFVYGKTPLGDRVSIANRLRDKTLPVAVVSVVWDEGLDIPELRSIVLAGGGKSAVKALQRIGRAMRRAPGKTHALIVDFYDQAHRFLLKHSKIRESYWANEKFPITYRQ